MSDYDNNDWAAFFVEQRHALTRYAIALTGNVADAHDLLQDVMVRLVRRANTPRDAKPYAMRCLRNAAIDLRRGRAADAAPKIAPAFLDESGADLRIRETVATVQAALAALPDRQREVIVLKLYCEMTFEQIARMLAEPLGTITSRYARGLSELRGLLKDEVRHAS